MTATYNGDDYALALPLSGHPQQVIDIARAFARLRAEHSARVTDLLDANNRYLERARLVERELDALNKQFAATARMLAEVARERDALQTGLAELQAGPDL